MPLLRDRALTAAFDRGADRYDRLVSFNPGYHAQLRRSARRLGLPDGGAGRRVLDLGCGTGASTAALAAVFPAAEVVGVDASAGMLERARAKRWPPGVRFVHAPAEDLGGAGVDGPFDAVLAAYCFRNLTDPDAVLRTVRGLLAPGGRLAVHEYALAGGRADRLMWDAVCRGVILPLGAVTGDRSLYRHLWRSVTAFDTAPEFGARLARGGFDRVRVLPLPGWHAGIAHTFVCRLGAAEPGRPAAGDARADGESVRARTDEGPDDRARADGEETREGRAQEAAENAPGGGRPGDGATAGGDARGPSGVGRPGGGGQPGGGGWPGSGGRPGGGR